jgi:hypothetical protein
MVYLLPQEKWRSLSRTLLELFAITAHLINQVMAAQLPHLKVSFRMGVSSA